MVATDVAGATPRRCRSTSQVPDPHGHAPYPAEVSRPRRATVAVLAAVLLAGCTAGGTGSGTTGPGTTGPDGAPTAASSGTAVRTYPPPPTSATEFRPTRRTRPVVVVLDAGHNGGNAAATTEINRLVDAGGFRKPCNTTGTATDAGYPEHRFTYDVVRRATALLRADGVRVVLTRKDDAGVGPCVDERAAVANRAGAALVVSVHADGAAHGVRGFHVIRPALAPDGGNRAILAPSRRAATALLTAFEQATGTRRAGYPGSLVRPGLTSRADLGGLNLARVPAVFVECANMRNPRDAALVSSPAWRQRAARGIADGVLAFVASSGEPVAGSPAPRAL